jgi:hypothetical protein
MWQMHHIFFTVYPDPHDNIVPVSTIFPVVSAGPDQTSYGIGSKSDTEEQGESDGSLLGGHCNLNLPEFTDLDSLTI